MTFSYVTKSCALTLLLTLSSHYSIAEDVSVVTDGSVSEIASQAKTFSMDEFDAAPKVRESGEEGYKVYTWIKYDWWECRVKWNESCSGSEAFPAPVGYQICNYTYKITESNERNGHSESPSDFFANDIESPPRFRSVNISIWAKGSHSPIDRYGSVIRLEQVGITYIDANATNQDRFNNHCWLPTGPG